MNKKTIEKYVKTGLKVVGGAGVLATAVGCGAQDALNRQAVAAELQASAAQTAAAASVEGANVIRAAATESAQQRLENAFFGAGAGGGDCADVCLPKATATEATLYVEPTATPLAESTPKKKIYRATVTPTGAVTSCEVITKEVGPAVLYTMGLPEDVNNQLTIGVAKEKWGDKYTNVLGFGTDFMLAEPGRLTNEIKEVDRMPYEFDIPKGAMAWIFGQEFKVILPDGVEFDATEWQNQMWGVGIRGKFDDKGVDATHVRIECGVKHHAQVQLTLPGAFLSEGQYSQKADAAHSAYDLAGKATGNCGGPGCKGLGTILYDDNTKAWEFLYQTGKDGPIQRLDGNWGK